MDAISVQGSRLCSERKPSLTRSQTDSNITYMSDEVPEAPGSACYITKEGDVDLQVVLKVITPVIRDRTSFEFCIIMLLCHHFGISLLRRYIPWHYGITPAVRLEYARLF